MAYLLFIISVTGDLTPYLKQFDFDFGTGRTNAAVKVVFMEVNTTQEQLSNITN